MQTGPYSAFPDAVNPVLTLLSYHGNLGLDNGRPQSVYVLDKTRLTPFRKPDGQDFRVDLALGKTVRLPNGAGSIRFDRVDRFLRVQISQSPGKGIALAGVLLGILGPLGSLRGRHGDIQADIDELSTRIQRHAEETA